MTGLEEAVLGLAATTPDTAWQQLQLRGELARHRRRRRGQHRAARPRRRPRPARRRARRPPHPRQLPHRHASPSAPWCRCARCRTASSACSASTTASSRGRASATATTCSPATRGSASATRAARTASCCSTPSAPPRTTSSSPTPAPTSAPAPRSRRPSRSASCSTRSTAPRHGPDGARVRDVVTTHHPLQPFDRAQLHRRRAAPRPAVQLRPAGHAGALAGGRPRADPAPFLAGPLPPRRRRTSSSPTCTGCSRTRPAASCASGCRSRETRGEDEPADALPVELDGLEQWAVGERLLHERLAGLDAAACIASSGTAARLPPGPLGDATLPRSVREVERLLHASAPDAAHEPESYDVDVPLGDGTRLTGTVGGARGDVLLSLHLLAAGRPAPAAGLGRPGRADRRPARRGVAGRRVGRGRDRPAASNSQSVLDPLPCRPTRRRAGGAGRALPRRAALAAAAAGQDRRRVRDRRRSGSARYLAAPAGPSTSGRSRDSGGTPSPASRRTPSTCCSTAPTRRCRCSPRSAPDPGEGRTGLARRRDRPVRPARPPAVGPAARRRDGGRDRDAPAAGPFDLLGPLPDGTTVLEASAGTGKTFTIAASSRATSPRASRRWTSCSSSASAASRRASCASASASAWSAPATGSPTRRTSVRRRPVLAHLAARRRRST